jgi:imidazolonepropionase-like amidohydrolase
MTYPRWALVSIAVFFLLARCTSPGPSKPETVLLIEDVTLVSPEREKPLEHASVLIRGEKIAEVGTGLKAPAGATVISGKGKFLLPGLVDAHVHLAVIPGVDLDEMPKDTRLGAEYFEQLPRSYLYFGYTTLIDLNAVFPAALSEFEAKPLHPDLHHCSSGLPIVNGYPMNFLPAKVRMKLFPNLLFDPGHPEALPPGASAEAHSPKAAVSRVKEAGALCVKTYWEKGFGREKNLPVPGPEMLKAIADEAKAQGLTSVVHANSLEAQEAVVGSGLEVIAHGLWNWGPVAKEKGLPARVKKVLDEVAARNIGYMPTLQVIGGLQAMFDRNYLSDPQLTRVLPKSLLAFYRSPEGKWFSRLLEKDEKTKLSTKTYDPILSRVGRATRYLAEKNARFVFGTDTPSAPTYGNAPGYNGYLEMKRWVSNGVSLSQLLKAATLEAAKAFRLEKEIGTVEPGKKASLLLVEKNPLETVEAYDAIDTVFVKGRAISRVSLAAP